MEIDVASGRTLRLVPLKGLDEVLGISWSHDGAMLAFSALTQGHTDLFTVPASGGPIRRLTNDLYADLQPAWSPDGLSIAFVTERYSTNIDSLAIGPLRLGTVTVADGVLHALPAELGS